MPQRLRQRGASGSAAITACVTGREVLSIGGANCAAARARRRDAPRDPSVVEDAYAQRESRGFGQGIGLALSPRKSKHPPCGRVFGEKSPGDDLLSHATAHYHRRGCVSLPSSGWDRVVPQRYVHQGEGGG